jgi:general secretion pathway protein D
MNACIPLSAASLVFVASNALASEELGSAPASLSSPASRAVDLLAIISSVSQSTHKKFLIDPRVAASVTLIGVDPREVSYPLLLTILAVHGFSTYEQEGVIVVTPDANERQVAAGPGASDPMHAADAEVVTTVVALKNTKANMLVPVLRPLMPQNAQLSAATDHNALIICDRAANVRRLIALISELDKLPVTKAE